MLDISVFHFGGILDGNLRHASFPWDEMDEAITPTS